MNKWIFCENPEIAGYRLPDTDETVLCCTKTKKGRKQIVTGYYMNGRWCCGMNSNVIAWMPLPALPED